MDKKENPKVEIILSNGKSVKLELFEEYAPITVKNFLSLVDKNFFDGTIFHRVIANFMIQTGGYFIKDNSIYEKDAETIKGEFKSNGIDNPLKHTPGVISMARTSVKDSASSQFFICVNECTHLDGEYAAFGKTIDKDSLNNVIEISKVKTGRLAPGFEDFPLEVISINTIKRI